MGEVLTPDHAASLLRALGLALCLTPLIAYAGEPELSEAGQAREAAPVIVSPPVAPRSVTVPPEALRAESANRPAGDSAGRRALAAASSTSSRACGGSEHPTGPGGISADEIRGRSPGWSGRDQRRRDYRECKSTGYGGRRGAEPLCADGEAHAVPDLQQERRVRIRACHLRLLVAGRRHLQGQHRRPDRRL